MWYLLWTFKILKYSGQLNTSLAFFPNACKFSLNTSVDWNQRVKIVRVFRFQGYIIFLSFVITYFTSSPCSSNTMISSTQKTTQARAICPARYVRSSADWALSKTEPGRATLTVYGRPVTFTFYTKHSSDLVSDWPKIFPNVKYLPFLTWIFSAVSLCAASSCFCFSSCLISLASFLFLLVSLTVYFRRK